MGLHRDRGGSFTGVLNCFEHPDIQHLDKPVAFPNSQSRVLSSEETLGHWRHFLLISLELS